MRPLFALLFCALLAAPAAAQDAWLIWIDGQTPKVESIAAGTATARPGLAIWSQGRTERWRVVPAGWKVPEPGSDEGSLTVASLAASRGPTLAGSSALEHEQMTTQLDQLRGAVAIRDLESAFLTPARGGRQLVPTITIRREPIRPAKEAKEQKVDPYPAAEATLTSHENKRSWKIVFPAGESIRKWAETGKLAKDLPKGLQPGTYDIVLRGQITTFEVEDKKVSGPILKAIEDMKAALGSPRDPLLAPFLVDHLLNQTNDKNEIHSLYLADVLDMLEAQPQTPWVAGQRQRVNDWLLVPPQDRPKAIRSAAQSPVNSTGVELIDKARGELEKGEWSKALETLASPDLAAMEKKDMRIGGLAELYRAVAAAEGGPARADECRKLFAHAAELLVKPADRIRVLNNWANYLQQEAQDHLYNHSLRMAAGVERPFGSILAPWADAETRYVESLKLAEGDAETTMALRTNLARHYNLLADLLATLSDKDFMSGEPAARQTARVWAERALAIPMDKNAAASRVLLDGMANELLAQIAYRQKDIATCRKHLERSKDNYLNVGFVAGVENLRRMAALTAQTPAESLKHFQVALLISESLRQRMHMDGDRVGATQAGFFARKAWVLDKMVEALINEGPARHREALEFVEQARARSLLDVVLTSSNQTQAIEKIEGTTSNFLDDWPAGVAALEYFLGGEQAYVFLVTPKGDVRAIPLTAADGKPLSSKDLIADVHRVLVNLEGQANKMFQRLSSGQGFDNQWQDDLHRLFKELIPSEAWKEVEAADTTVIVPQHILHYFPFAALVLEKDSRTLTPKQMAAPTKFFVEMKGTRVQAPSLTFWRLMHSNDPRPIQQISAVGLVQAPGADELPGVDKDLKNLQSVFAKASKKPLRFVDGNKATPDAAKRFLQEAGMVFVATHGFNDADRPLQSFLLLLDKTGKSEGRLTAEDLFREKIDADLVVMSACYSGLGDRSPLPGDDLFGLQRAMLQSGARAVIAGLWDVYDDTAPDLMHGFFQHFGAGKPVAAALQESQRDFLRARRTGKTDPWIHPYFWGVYTVSGDERVAFMKKGN
jgi:CHAT domain-containing protein